MTESNSPFVATDPMGGVYGPGEEPQYPTTGTSIPPEQWMTPEQYAHYQASMNDDWEKVIDRSAMAGGMGLPALALPAGMYFAGKAGSRAYDDPSIQNLTAAAVSAAALPFSAAGSVLQKVPGIAELISPTARAVGAGTGVAAVGLGSAAEHAQAAEAKHQASLRLQPTDDNPDFVLLRQQLTDAALQSDPEATRLLEARQSALGTKQSASKRMEIKGINTEATGKAIAKATDDLARIDQHLNAMRDRVAGSARDKAAAIITARGDAQGARDAERASKPKSFRENYDAFNDAHGNYLPSSSMLPLSIGALVNAIPALRGLSNARGAHSKAADAIEEITSANPALRPAQRDAKLGYAEAQADQYAPLENGWLKSYRTVSDNAVPMGAVGMAVGAAPSGYDYFNAPFINPEKGAQHAYVERLVDDDPIKRLEQDKLVGLPDVNPDYKNSHDLTTYLANMGMGALESYAGSKVTGIPGKLAQPDFKDIRADIDGLRRAKPVQPVPTPRNPPGGAGGNVPGQAGGQVQPAPIYAPPGAPPPPGSPPTPVAAGTARYSQAFRDPTSNALSSDFDAMAHLYDIAPTQAARDQIVQEAGRMRKMDLQPLRREYRDTGLDQPSDKNLRGRINETVKAIEDLHAQGQNPFDARVRSQILGGSKQLALLGAAGGAALGSGDAKADRIEEAIDRHVFADDGLLKAVGGDPKALGTSANRAALARAMRLVGAEYPELDPSEVRKAVFDMARGQWRNE